MVGRHIDRLLIQLDPKSGSELDTPKPLADFDRARAIVVLGDPGMGKTEELRHAAIALGTRLIPVQEAVHRSTLAAGAQRLFLDALDESRSTGATIDTLIAKLVDADTPSFVLSCRVADWYGSSDLRRIQQVYGEANVAVLRLLGFTEEHAKEFVAGLVSDPDVFVNEAKRLGLSELLENPNDLALLAKIVSSGWPSTRLELFERSSIQMAREQNEDRARSLPTVHDDVLLDAAGAVCTSLLVTGTRGVCLDQVGDIDPNFATPADFAADPSLVERLARSNLFIGDTPRYVRPRHRTTAEFLSARWLARQIASGEITLRRVLAILAPDGRPPTELRGIVAWLVTRLPNTDAMHVIGIDPFGLLIYGDAATFDVARLGALLAALEHLARSEPYFRVNAWMDGPWLVFVRPGLSNRIESILTQDDPNDHLLDGLLSALAAGGAIGGIAPSILKILYSAKADIETKTRAVRAFLRQGGACSDVLSVYQDCAAKKISDENGRLRVELYRRCHTSIPAARFAELLVELWDERDLSIGSLYHKFVHEIPSATLATIFDLLGGEQRRRANIHSLGGLSPHHCSFEIRHFLEEALVRIDAGGLVTVERAANWRQLFNTRRSDDNAAWNAIWARLDDGAQLFIYVFEREVLPGDPAGLWSRFCHQLWSSDSVITVSDNAIRYLINLAAAEPHEGKAQAIARCTTMFVWGSKSGPDLFLLAEELWSPKSYLVPFLDGLRFCEIPEWRVAQARETKAHRLRAERERNRTIKSIQDNLDGIRGWWTYDLLRFVGRLYFFGWNLASGVGADTKLTKQAAFEELLGKELGMQLEDALVEGLRTAKLPSPDEQAEWCVNNQHYRAECGVLAAMELLLKREPLVGLSLESTSAIIPLVLRHWGMSTLTETKRDHDGIADGWFWTVFRERPQLVIESVLRFLGPSARRGGRLSDLNSLFANAKATQESSVLLASSILGELRPAHHEDLDDALQVLLSGGRADAVAKAASERLQKAGDLKERAFWIGTGWLASPTTFSDALAVLLRDGIEDEIWTALRVIFPDRHGAPSRTLSLGEASWLAEWCGGRFGWVARPSGVTHGNTNPWDATEIVNRLVEQISADNSSEATNSLAYLSEVPGLASYRTGVLHALAMQRNRRRDKEFSPPTLRTLKDALESRGIASADDAIALATDQLELLQRQYRGGDTTGWQKYWNNGTRGTITNPRIEDRCRDVLLDDLRPLLRPFGLDVNQATPANAGNEADGSIQAAGTAGVRVPIEMKMQTNAEVWTAPREQLSRKYVIDPRSGGRGVYVVFWTGSGTVPVHPNGLPRPLSAGEMQKMLVELLSQPEREQIAIVVIDVSVPNAGDDAANTMP